MIINTVLFLSSAVLALLSLAGASLFLQKAEYCYFFIAFTGIVIFSSMAGFYLGKFFF
jgi:hypothetical protein